MTTSRIWILILSAVALAGQVPDTPSQNAGLQVDDNDPELPGLVCRMAMFAQVSGDLPGAEKLVRHGLTLFVRNKSLETTAGAACLTTFASLLESRGHEQEAQEQLEHVLAIREQLLGRNHLLVADALVRLGLVHSRQGHIQEAEGMQSRAVAILRLQEPSTELAAALNNLGTVMSAQNRWKEAEAKTREAISIWENLGGPDDPDVAAGLLNLGVLLEKRKRYDEAASVLSRARKIDEKAFPANHPRIAMDLNAAGILATDRKNYREAEDLLVRAAAILESSQSPQHAETGQVLLNLAEVYRLQKKMDPARETYQRGLAAVTAAWGPNDARLPQWMEKLAAVLREEQDYAGAEELEIRATRIRVLHTIR
jgi:tetratricopeptide (TPR) repeat protein